MKKKQKTHMNEPNNCRLLPVQSGTHLFRSFLKHLILSEPLVSVQP